jgi:serine/threonine protein phosphatase PrpC
MGHDDAKLTNDHKPESKLERQRIEKAGGAVATKSVFLKQLLTRIRKK